MDHCASRLPTALMAIAGIFKEFGLEPGAHSKPSGNSPAMIITPVTEHFVAPVLCTWCLVSYFILAILVCFVFLAAPGWAEAYRLYVTQIQMVGLPSLSQSLLLLCLTSLGLRFGFFVLFCLFVCLFFYLWKLKAGLLVFKISEF